MSPSKHKYFVAAFLLVLALAYFRTTITDALSGDVAMYLQCGKLLLQGQTLYVDFIDLNPPLVFFISMVPAALSMLTAMPLLLAGSITCSAFALLSLAVTACVLFRAKTAMDPVMAGCMMLAVATLSAFTTYDFGQREHLLALAWIPYFCLRWARLNGIGYNRYFIFAVAFVAGLLSCFKPHFLLCPVVLELCLGLPIILNRTRRATFLFVNEYSGLIAGGLAYATSLACLPKGSRDFLFGYLTPLVSSAYSSFDSGDGLVMLTPLWVPTLIVVGLGLVLFTLSFLPFFAKNYKDTPWRTFGWAAVGQVLCGLLLIQIQHKGWFYHGIPMMVAALQLIGVSFACLVGRLNGLVQFGVAFVITTLGIGLSCIEMEDVHSLLHMEYEKILPTLVKAGDHVAYLDTSDTPWFVRMGASDLWPGSRYLWLFPVPMYRSLLAHKVVDQAKVDVEMTRLMTYLREDLERGKAPLVVLKANHCYALPPQFDMEQYLTPYGLSQALEHYKLVVKTEQYRYYKRVN